MSLLDKIQKEMVELTEIVDKMMIALNILKEKEKIIKENETEQMSKKQEIIKEYFNDVDKYDYGMNLLPDILFQ